MDGTAPPPPPEPDRRPPPGTQIRRSTRDDTGAFVELMEAVAGEGRWIGRELPLERDERMGHADLGMLLAADARGLGLGSALPTEAIAWADAHPVVHKITLQAWPHNTAAVGLYRKYGFQMEGYLHRHWRRRNGELWDAVLMGLPVTDRT